MRGSAGVGGETGRVPPWSPAPSSDRGCLPGRCARTQSGSFRLSLVCAVSFPESRSPLGSLRGGVAAAVLCRAGKGGWRPWVPTGGVACSAAGQSAVQAGISRDLSAICWLESRLCQERPSQRGLWTRAPSPLACRTRAACGAAPLDASRGAALRLLGLRRRSWPPVPAARFTEAQTPGGGTVDCSPRCPRPEPHCRARRL